MTTRDEVLAMAEQADIIYVGVDGSAIANCDSGSDITEEILKFHAATYALAFEAGRKAAEQDRVDAERYRWIRENGDKGIFVFDPDKKPRIELAQRDELDTLIDRERSAK